MQISFSRAVKYESKGRVALIGPAGSGKSFTMLTIARLLAGPDGKIAAVDTEQGSLSKYADLFDFDVAPLKSFTAENFLVALRAAEQGGYSVFCCDSLSHFWMGKDGALEFVDAAAKHSSSRDNMSGWKEFRPVERQMVDAMIASPLHVICTMRTKTAYEEQVNERTGKKQRVKIGLAPVQREGLEYEFDLVGLMDEDNTFIVDKTRCPALSGKAIQKPKAEDLATFRDWLNGVAAPVTTAQPSVVVEVPKATQPISGLLAPHVEGNILLAHVLNVEHRQSKATPPRPFFAVKIAGKINDGSLLFCWHQSLADALTASVGNNCQFEIEKSGNFLNINNVLEVGAQEYRDGKPYTDQRHRTSNQVNPEITDQDVPF